MKKHRLIIALILLWVAICLLLILISQIIFWQPDWSYTSLLGSYAVQKDMPAEVAVFLLGGEGTPYGYTTIPYHFSYATFGNGMVIISYMDGKVFDVNRVNTYGCWVFYGFMLSTAIAEAIVYFRLRKEEVVS